MDGAFRMRAAAAAGIVGAKMAERLDAPSSLNESSGGQSPKRAGMCWRPARSTEWVKRR